MGELQKHSGSSLAKVVQEKQISKLYFWALLGHFPKVASERRVNSVSVYYPKISSNQTENFLLLYRKLSLFTPRICYFHTEAFLFHNSYTS